SMTHRMNVHGPACSEVLSGRPYFGPPTTDQASREDWPSLGSLVMRYGQSDGGLPPSAVLPCYLQFPGQPKRIAGQTGGRMGERHSPFLVSGDIDRPEFELEGLRPAADRPAARLRDRRYLLERLDHPPGPDSVEEALAGSRRAVYELLGSPAAAAFDLGLEPRGVRDR